MAFIDAKNYQIFENWEHFEISKEMEKEKIAGGESGDKLR